MSIRKPVEDKTSKTLHAEINRLREEITNNSNRIYELEQELATKRALEFVLDIKLHAIEDAIISINRGMKPKQKVEDIF